MLTTQVNIPGYQVDKQIYNGCKTIVYRGYRESDSLPVAIKLLKNPYPTFSELVQFRNQYTIAKNINSSLILQTYSLETYKNSYILIMEDFGGISLNQWEGKEKISANLVDFLQIAIALTDALDILYRHNIIHKDIKPANILINPDTKKIKLIDFSIASLLPRETQIPTNPHGLEGTLEYLSPEQTGRMNRGIDYRTDFYSLGVTFYELLTGGLPFQSDDPLQLVHCHIAKQPPHTAHNGEIPQVLWDIIMKLMAKNAEDRYQSALGLKCDLENCLSQIKEAGKIEDFKIAQWDLCDRFIISDKLYGREAEIATLLTAFERVTCGATEIMLVAGFSGIGKTAIVNEIHKPIIQQQGYFVQGKFDQFNHNIPLSAFVQALRDLMRQLLSESDSKIEYWKSQILSAIGNNGQVIIEVIPELEQIIGSQPIVPQLSTNAAQNRLNLLFQKLIAIFTRKEHPLTIFFDDLQWADSTSLNLIKLLTTEITPGYLFIIGAFRNNEVSSNHPLICTLNEIKNAGITINTITLLPLSVSDNNRLIADALKCTLEESLDLTKFIYQKTQGNPFFNNQFLKSLKENGSITFNMDAKAWEFDINQIYTLDLNDDVVDLIVTQLKNLPQSTQNSLKLAACIGTSFKLKILSIITEKSQIDTANDLWQALKEGFILPRNEASKFSQSNIVQDNNKLDNIFIFEDCEYKFLYDRVQQAAYSLIPEEEKPATHLKIGQLIIENNSPENCQENIFEIVNQLNIGRALINQESEREQLIILNLTAVRKAKAATAYSAASNYLAICIELLPFDSWNSHYDLTLKLYEEAVEIAYLNADYQLMEEMIEIVLSQAKTLIDKIKVYETKILAIKAKSQLRESIEVGLELLKLLDVEFSKQPTSEDIGEALTETLLAWKEISIPSLLGAKEMSDPIKLAAMRILTQLTPSAYQAFPSLMPLLIFKQIIFIIAEGNCPISAFSYADYGLVLCGIVGDLDAGYKFGELALNIIDRFQGDFYKCRTYFIVYSHIHHWKSPLSASLPFFLEAYQVGLAHGDLESSALNAQMYCCHAYFVGKELVALASEMDIYRQAVEELKQQGALTSLEICQQTVLNLLGHSDDPCQLVGDIYDENESLPLLKTLHNRAAIYHLYYHKTVISYLLGKYQQAAFYASLVESYADIMPAAFTIPLFNFYNSLLSLQLYTYAETKQEKNNYLKKVVTNQRQLKQWSNSAPMNHLHKFYLVEAEYHQLLANYQEAIEYYDRAIRLAQENKYIQDEALANELAAKFYLTWGKERIAQSYIIDAYYCYVHWGAKVKIEDLEQRYPQLLAPILQKQQQSLNANEIIPIASFHSSKAATLGINSISETLDLATIIKASQTLSREIELDKLLIALLEVLLENAGADKCVLLLPKNEQWVIEGICQLGQSPIVLQSIPMQLGQYLPISLINSVKHSLKASVIFNAVAHANLAVDPYVLHQRPKSVLCTPILNQGKLVGILYLENSLTTGAFTSDRLELLNLICTQAAIALENARTYQQAQNYGKQLEQSLEALNASEARFQKLADNIPGVIYQLRLNQNGSFSMSYISSGCYELYEVTAEELISTGRSIRSFEHPEDVTKIDEAILNSAQNLTPFQYQWRIITPSGQIKWIQALSQPERQENNELIWDGVILDISQRQAALQERKRAETERQKKAEALETALQELQQTQIQLVQNEKMSALGNLVAGVAHEINNPIAFLGGNIQPALEHIQDLFGLVDLYQEKYPHPEAEIENEIIAIDLDYIREDLPNLVGSMREGVKRICEISNSLRTFSRKDSNCPVACNLHDGIDSTIMILKHRLKASDSRPEIQIIKQYGEIPSIECFAGQLNQVFMNLLANAIDALEESNIGYTYAQIKANPNLIIITTQIADNPRQIIISIKDNGKGMTPEVKQKIFDHLFTTKSVGKGTGLGLAIARQIVVEKHHGAIDVNSTLGEGSEFLIRLPF
ncbi:AAA family ATPase [Calothrix sp. PCC 6303]|uniref:ATP-binding sensor histidine kinase n=1 Tax=Calothrix sp. PCC 6303 TaxID=1170562 RepID=UPI0002A05178|nr:AAA family ATPase [Calothrix sp. PCC 6303]AFZ02801.1 multi-sensor signal transduction multi-kinase [Calothrix sp. PCC 6303]